MLNISKKKAVKIALLMSTVIFAILSIIPPIRWLGAYALRSTSIISSANFCQESWKSDSHMARFFKCLSVTVVFLSLFALIFPLPSFILAVMVLTAGLQFLNFLRSLNKKDWKMASIQASMFILDILMIAALVTGLWQLIVALSALSACLMLGIGIYLSFSALNNNGMPSVESLYYFALSLGSMACAISAAELGHDQPTITHFDLKNSSDHDIYVYDKNGLLVVLKPGESKHLDIPHSDLERVLTDAGVGYSDYTSMLMLANGPHGSGTYIEPNSTDYQYIVDNPAISPQDFPTVPLTSAALSCNPQSNLDENGDKEKTRSKTTATKEFPVEIEMVQISLPSA